MTALDKIQCEDKIKALIQGVLAGNIFDWRAKEIADLMETLLVRDTYEQRQRSLYSLNETQDGKFFFENEIDDRTQKIDEASSIILNNEEKNESIENNN